MAKLQVEIRFDSIIMDGAMYDRMVTEHRHAMRMVRLLTNAVIVSTMAVVVLFVEVIR